MEITIRSITLIIAIVLTGLSAGLFYAWEVSVIPGTKRIGNLAYVETMQAINRAIINPAFMLIFLGSLVAQTIGTFQYRSTNLFWFLLTATVTYFVGTILVTALGNVPLNDALDTISIKELSKTQIASERTHYELRWNRLHTIRTVFSVLSFILMIVGLFNYSK
ncbi:MAG: hypothetical protein CMO01_27950 [Thalassobius sp.]|nr:hypothetical protein [Thalassovita sp.]